MDIDVWFVSVSCSSYPFFRFSASTFFFFCLFIQIDISKKPCKGHLFFIQNCVAQNHLRCVTISQCISSSITMSWTIRCAISSGYWVALKSAVAPKKYLMFDIFRERNFVLTEFSVSSQLPPFFLSSFSIVLILLNPRNPQLLVHSKFVVCSSHHQSENWPGIFWQ